MNRDYKLYLEDIRKSISLIEDYVKDCSEEKFLKDIGLQDAVIRRLEIIGEASSKLPRALKEKNQNIPWLNMIGFRNFITHQYFEASLSRVWKIVKEDIRKIKQELQNIKLV